MTHSSWYLRELTAVLLSLMAFLPIIRNKSVQILTDNIYSAASVNFQGPLPTAKRGCAKTNTAGMGHCNCLNVEHKNISETKKNVSCTTNKIAKSKV